MAGNSFCLLLVGLLVIAIGSFFASFGVAWGLVDSEYAHTPAIRWILVGGLTATSAVFKIKLPEAADQTSIFTLIVSPDETLQNNRTTVVLGGDNSVVSMELQHGIYTVAAPDLKPQTQYYYAVEEVRISNGIEPAINADLQGRIRTPAEEGKRFNFTIATAGCAWTGSRTDLFQEIEKKDPLMFLHLGDLHYEDISENNMGKRIDAISTVLASDTQSHLYRSTSFNVMWDDHDWFDNNSNGLEKEKGARDTALLSYQIAFPHYPLAALEAKRNTTISTNDAEITGNTTVTMGFSSTSTENPIAVPVYHAFTLGTVRFVVSDLRSEANETFIYSKDQSNWLKDEFSRAADYDFVIWVTTKPWIGAHEPGDDSWTGYAQDRLQLSEYISTKLGGEDGPQNVLAVSADAHMIGFDSGFNTFYGPTGFDSVRSFPILQSGSLDRFGSAKGETYTEGCQAFKLERTHQFSTLKFEFAEDGVGKCIQIDSYRKIDFANQGLQHIFETRLCDKIFARAAVSEDHKVGTCTIDRLWVVNDNMVIAASVIAFLTIIFSYFALYKSDASDIGDCCCKSFAVTLIIAIGYFLTIAVGIGVFYARGVEQVSVAPALINMVIQMSLSFLYLLIWWSCCTRPNLRRLDDGDPAFRDVEPNPTFQHVGMDLQYNGTYANGDGSSEAPGGNSSTNNSANIR